MSLAGRRFGHAVGGGFDSRPACDEFVVGAGVFGLAKAFAKGVETIGELANRFGFAAKRGEECAGSGFAALLQGTDELVQCFPDGRACCRMLGPNRLDTRPT